MSAIAIVGMGCRFGGAPDLHAYWAMTLEGRHGFTPVPEDRWPHAAFYDTSRRATDKAYAPAGGFVDDIRTFPALFFGIPPRRVEVMDPQQRLSIEVGLQAIHDSGRTPDQMPRRTGVFMGVTASEFRVLLSSRVIATLMAAGQLGESPDDGEAIAAAVGRVVPSRPFTAAGALANMIAAAVAQELNLKGPAYTVDAACASALVAVSDAVAQLRAGSIDAAVVGGVYLQITPEHYIAFSRIGAMSAQGRCRPFDHRADGFVQGDGGGAVVLKRLADAVADGDRIYAVIEGVALNNDGRGDGPMAPVLEGQAQVIRDAWADADRSPDQLRYVEAHGTGTDVGDVTEVRALHRALGDLGAEVQLGSSKANVGHTMSAAAIAGLIRTALAIHHGTIPPMSGFDQAKDELDLPATPFRVPTEAQPWPEGERVAALSSFGFGGTNGHLVLRNAPDPAPVPATDQLELIRLSAGTEAGLRRTAGRLADALRSSPQIRVASVARTWAARPAVTHRAALVAADRQSLIAQLDALSAGEIPKGVGWGQAQGLPPAVALMFPGQGAQRVGLLASVRDRFGEVSRALAAADDDVADLLPVPLTTLLYPDDPDDPAAEAALTRTEHCQPAMVAAGLALWRLLEAVGVRPVVATGHSLGEFVAAAVGGVISPRDALRFATQRGQAMAGVPGDPGTMAALSCDADTARTLLVDGAVLANDNHPNQVVVSGATDAVDRVVEHARSAGIEVKPLDVSHGFHSPVFAGLDTDALLADIAIHDPGEITIASGIAEGPYRDGDDARSVFARHATSPVAFQGALEQCVEAGAEVFLQVGGGGPLASFARAVVADRARTVLTLSGPRRRRRRTRGPRGVGPAVGPRGPDRHLPHHRPRPLRQPAPHRAAPGGLLAGQGPGAEVAEPRRRGRHRGPPDRRGPRRRSGPDHQRRRGVRQGRRRGRPGQLVPEGGGAARSVPGGRSRLRLPDGLRPRDGPWPRPSRAWGGCPQELLLNRPTVAAIAAHVATAGRSGPDAIDDDAPLVAYRPGFVPCPLPEGPPDPDALAGRTILLTGDRDEQITAALKASGARITRRSAAAADLVVHHASFADPVPTAAILSGEAPIPDPAADLLSTLAHQASLGATPSVIVVARADDPWAHGLAGVVRSAMREGPVDGVFKTLWFDDIDPAFRAARLVQEILSTDKTNDVRWDPRGRSIAGLQRADLDEGPPLGPDDRVLISGGTRGIGLALATHLASIGTSVVVIGRTLPDDLPEGIVGVAADVTDGPAVAAAVADHRPFTAVIHAAGVLADGPIGEVDAALGSKARKVKVAGLLNLLNAAGDTVRVAVGIGSWAGRFGNRHQAHYAAGNATPRRPGRRDVHRGSEGGGPRVRSLVVVADGRDHPRGGPGGDARRGGRLRRGPGRNGGPDRGPAERPGPGGPRPGAGPLEPAPGRGAPAVHRDPPLPAGPRHRRRPGAPAGRRRGSDGRRRGHPAAVRRRGPAAVRRDHGHRSDRGARRGRRRAGRAADRGSPYPGVPGHDQAVDRAGGGSGGSDGRGSAPDRSRHLLPGRDLPRAAAAGPGRGGRGQRERGPGPGPQR